jgi:Skp family chaperone for outer membrane proteins
MSQTPITVTYSLEEILKEINTKLDKLDEKFETKFEKFEAKFDNLDKKFEAKFDNLQKDVNDLKVGQAELSAEVKGINKRLDNQEFINRSVAVGFLLAFRTGIIKILFPNFLNLPH